MFRSILSVYVCFVKRNILSKSAVSSKRTITLFLVVQWSQSTVDVHSFSPILPLCQSPLAHRVCPSVVVVVVVVVVVP